MLPPMSTQLRVGFEDIVESSRELWTVQTAGAGPRGSLPLTGEMLLEWSSGDLFGLTQNAGMGWDPRELTRPQFLMRSPQGVVRAPDGVTLPPKDGEDAGRVQSLGARFAQGEVTLERAAELGCRACGTPGGGCQFLGTAATSQVVGEALGLSLPHSALAPSGQPIWL